MSGKKSKYYIHPSKRVSLDKHEFMRRCERDLEEGRPGSKKEAAVNRRASKYANEIAATVLPMDHTEY